MAEAQSDRFVRFPTPLLEALMRARLSGGQYRVLFWVVRRTFGWNRQWAEFTWYRIAKEIGMPRPAAYRAGQTLLKAGILIAQERQLSLQPDCGLWDSNLAGLRSVAGQQLWMPGIDVAGKQRPPLPQSNAGVAGTQPERPLQATLFRRAKDIKDSLKTCIKTGAHNDPCRRVGHRDNTERRHLATAAKPIPGKYERFSQD